LGLTAGFKRFAEAQTQRNVCFERMLLRFKVAFSHDVAGFLVTANSGEARMTQSIILRPFQEIDSYDDEWV
jgi:hypothetical protein